MIFRLEELGYQWEIFNNGLHSDYEFGLDVLKYIGVENKKKFYQKTSGRGRGAGADYIRL